MKTIFLGLIILVIVFGLSASADAILVVQGDAVYETGSNLSWVRNASLGGQMSWGAANIWAAGLTINGLTGWRQPTITELQYLFNQGVSIYSPGPFIGLQDSGYWSGTEYAEDTTNAWPANFTNGYTAPPYSKVLPLYAWAVRSGPSTPATPVPATGTAGLIALTLAGLVIYGVRLNMKRA